MREATIELMNEAEELISTFHISEKELYFIYDYLGRKGAVYYAPGVQSILIDVDKFKKDMFIEILDTNSIQDPLINNLRKPNNETFLKNIVKAIEPLGSGTYLFGFHLY